MTAEVQEFIHTLESEKAALQKLYAIDGQEYNLLAQMAIGILGRESLFFTSERFHLKEDYQWLVDLAKYVEGKDSANSRGPTQIKKVPDPVIRFYGINVNDLWEPRAAAVTTMGFLIESLAELKVLSSHYQLQFINEGTYSDYLPYIYIGETKKLISGQAQPAKNAYIIAMKKYMSWVQLRERDPGT